MECKNKHRLVATKRIADGVSQKKQKHRCGVKIHQLRFQQKRTNLAKKTQRLDVKIHLNEVSTKSRDWIKNTDGV